MPKFLYKWKNEKEVFVGFYATESTTGEALLKLVTNAITNLNLDLKNIVGKAFDGPVKYERYSQRPFVHNKKIFS